MFNWSLKISVVVKKYLLIVLPIETLGKDIITLIISPRLQPEIIEIWTTSCAPACRQNININIAAEKNTLLKKIGKRKGKTYENTSITILVKDKYKENNTFKYFIECFHDLLNISDNLLFCAPCNACCSSL